MDAPTAPDRGATLSIVRTATQAAHLALEGSLGLLDPNLGLPAYTEVLRRLYGFWSAWEPHIAVKLDDAPLLEPRRRLHLLADDLTALGLSMGALASVPICPPVDIGSGAAALGSLYVMEGSTLGGKMIGRNLVRCLGPGVARSYFDGYGPRTGAMWRDFLVVLDRVPADRAEQAVSGANATFERLGWWLSRGAIERGILAATMIS